MNKAIPFFTLFCLFIFVQCDKKTTAEGNSGLNGLEMHEIDMTPPADALFQKLPSAETGITFRNDLKEDWTNNVLTFSYLYNAGGVGVIDVNNDGLQDVYFTSTLGSCKLYLNKGGFKFEDISAKAGVEAQAGIKCGVTIADVNGDGWQDIYVTRTGIVANDNRRNLLFINNQNGTFSEKAKAMGLDDGAPHTIANFFDYDLDGDLDCFLANHPSDFKTVQRVLLQQDKSGKTSRVFEPQKPEESGLARYLHFEWLLPRHHQCGLYELHSGFGAKQDGRLVPKEFSQYFGLPQHDSTVQIIELCLSEQRRPDFREHLGEMGLGGKILFERHGIRRF